MTALEAHPGVMTPGRLVVRLLPGLAAAAFGLVWLLVPGPDVEGWWAAFALAALLGEFVPLQDLHGRPVPTSLAVLAAFALLGNPPWAIAALAAAAWGGATVIRWIAVTPLEPLEGLHRLAGAWSLAGLAAVGWALPTGLLNPGLGAEGHALPLASVLAVGLGLVLGPAVWGAAEARPGDGLARAFVLRLDGSWRSSLALASSGALVAIVHGVVGAGALLLLLLPVLAVRAGFHRYGEIRRTYDQTVVAMTRMTELTGHVPEGHGVRVGELSSATAVELGASEREIRRVERAALLHEVGRISTDDPVQHADDREVAAVGAAIVREAGGMPDVAEVVDRHRDPYRRPGSGEDATLPLAARIVRVTCEYDRLVSGGAEPWEAIETLHRSMAYDHDPVVVTALTRVVDRRH